MGASASRLGRTTNIRYFGYAAVLVAAWMQVGCGVDPVKMVKVKAASDLACNETDVTVVKKSETRFDAAGCGKEQEYTCQSVEAKVPGSPRSYACHKALLEDKKK